MVVPQAQALPWAVALVQAQLAVVFLASGLVVVVQAADIATAHLLGCFVVVILAVYYASDQFVVDKIDQESGQFY